MKKIYSVMIMCVAALTSMLFVSCERDIVPTETVLSVIDEEITPSYTLCKVTCSFYTDATIEYASVQYSTTEDFARYNVTKMTKNTDDGSYSVELTKLQVNTTYYFRYEVNACVFTSSQADKVSEFQTLNSTVPVVTTTSATDISVTSATVGGILYDAGWDIMECGIVYGTSHNPTTASTKVKSDGWDDSGLFTCKLINLKSGTTYYARAYMISEDGIGYGKEIKFIPAMENGHIYVDLGLSVKWATCNVGANKPEEPGDYFAWGETMPKDYYDWSNYKWCAGGYYELTKYCDDHYCAHSSSYVDKIYVLQLSDDAARVNWGGNWRMPLKSEFDELYNSCTWTSTTQNGTKGYLVTGKNGNSIFLPHAGYKSEGSLRYLGSYGYYWSSTVCPDSSSDPYYAYAYSYGKEELYRSYGLPIRPVCQ